MNRDPWPPRLNQCAGNLPKLPAPSTSGVIGCRQFAFSFARNRGSPSRFEAHPRQLHWPQRRDAALEPNVLYTHTALVLREDHVAANQKKRFDPDSGCNCSSTLHPQPACQNPNLASRCKAVSAERRRRGPAPRRRAGTPRYSLARSVPPTRRAVLTSRGFRGLETRVPRDARARYGWVRSAM